jgi:hypothetical protein
MSIPAQVLSVCSSQDARIEVTFLYDKYILHSDQTDAGPWSGWRILGEGSKLSQVVSALDGDMRLAIGWLNDGQIWVSAANQPNGDLLNAIGLDSQGLQQLRLLTNKNGKFEFLALSSENVLWSVAQSEAGSWDNMIITDLGGTDLQQLACTSYGDGRLTAVVLGKDKKVYRKEQSGPGGPWGAWQGLDGNDIQGVAASANANDDLLVAAVGGDGYLYTIVQTVGGLSGGWGPSVVGPAKFVLAPQLAKNKDGHLEIFAYDNDSFLYHSYQSAPNGDWVSPAVIVDPTPNVFFPIYATTTLTNGIIVLLSQFLCDVSLYAQPAANAHSLTRIPNPGTPCPPQIVSFKANPSTAGYGTISKLTWDVEFPNGVCPKANISISGQPSGGTVEVLGPPPPLTAFPTSGSALWQIRGEAKITLTANCDGSPFQPTSKTITVQLQGQPANAVVLEMALALSPPLPPEGTNFNAIITITNTGNEASTPFEVQATDNGAAAGMMPSLAIPPGAQKSVTFLFIVPSDGEFSTLAFTIPAYPATPAVSTVVPG